MKPLCKSENINAKKKETEMPLSLAEIRGASPSG